MNNLKEKLSMLVWALEHKRVVYIDYPVHQNVGDQLIWIGAIRLLESRGIEIIAQFSRYNYSRKKILDLKRQYGDSFSIVLHGGGNWGDIYRTHQECRLRVIRDFPDMNVVIFPQTVYYVHDKTRESDLRAFSSHKSLQIFVRDSRSLDLLRGFHLDCKTCPDTAHMLWKDGLLPLAVDGPAEGALVWRRIDKESCAPRISGSFDWKQSISMRRKLWTKSMQLASNLRLGFRADQVIAASWHRVCEQQCVETAKVVSRHSSVDTDRLHGHILASLLSIPNNVGDNSYGKNSSYINEWMNGSELVEVH